MSHDRIKRLLALQRNNYVEMHPEYGVVNVFEAAARDNFNYVLTRVAELEQQVESQYKMLERYAKILTEESAKKGAD